ncbi:MAG: cytochrome P450, partial [Dinoroseobacter sp.]
MSVQYVEQDDVKRKALTARMMEGDLTVLNSEVVEAFKIDPHFNVNDIPLDDLDPSHPALFSNDTLWEHFARLRKEDPVHYHKNSIGGAYWSVTRYEDIMEVDKRHDVFSSEQRLGGITLGGQPREEDDAFSLPMFIQADPPKHDEQRKVVAPLFMPKQLAELEPLIRERIGLILDELPVDEEFNWVEKVSVELTGQMLATLFDIPQEDRLKLIYWSDTVQQLGDPEKFETPEEGFQVLFECLAYFTEYYEKRKKEPAKFDLISMMAHNPSTNNMSPQELLGNIILLIV